MNFPLILKFLKDLSKNNNREWFEKNKPKYLVVKKDFEDFITSLLEELIKIDGGLAGLNPKKLPFRIYRDVRFSKDKSPYKLNMGAGFSPGGKMMQEPGYYLHIEPGKSFLAGGLYMPDAGNLSKVRQEIDYNAAKFTKILNDKKFKKIFAEGLDPFDKLKTIPKGYSKDHPQIEFLKHKSFIVSHYFSDKEVTDKKFIKTIIEVCKTVKPLNDFLKESIA